MNPLCYSALVLMKSPCRGPTFRIKRFAWQLLTDESQRGIMHFDIGHVLWGWAAQPTPNVAPASPQTNNNNMSSCLTQLLRPKIISTLKWDDTLIKMPSIFQEKTRRTILFPSNLNPIDCISLSSIHCTVEVGAWKHNFFFQVFMILYQYLGYFTCANLFLQHLEQF